MSCKPSLRREAATRALGRLQFRAAVRCEWRAGSVAVCSLVGAEACRVHRQVFQLAIEAVGYIGRGAIGYRQTVDQMAQTGFNSLPLVVLTLGFTGMVMAFHLGSRRAVPGGQPGWVAGG